jgi:hypothetical protein
MYSRLSRRRWLAALGAAAVGGLAGEWAVPAILRAAEASWGDLTIRFVYDGKAPERKKLVVDKDVEYCGKFDIRDESLLVGPDGGLANVFVFLRTPKPAVSPELESSLPKEVVLDNAECIFKPHCLGLWYEKQQFRIINSDPIAQNVDFRPTGDAPANIVLPPHEAKKPAAGNSGEEPPKTVEATWKFTRPQIAPILIKCNYHPWESGYILIRANPYFAISAADGTLRIPKLPGGKLEFQLWHGRVGPLEAPGWPKGRCEIEIRPGTNDLGAIRLPPPRFEPPAESGKNSPA